MLPETSTLLKSIFLGVLIFSVTLLTRYWTDMGDWKGYVFVFIGCLLIYAWGRYMSGTDPDL
ncbi:hypothetical protein [Persicitalea jodogahamensis]|uniref:Uncharacterized protein n=1 Tax=Persicitalea jodogahamensis TaxID=402147 RepID=A0A8J3GBN2_9BACT|nr:hypothetical protein [Persicitalea jodogahamensis]GHB83141.1 hypothetical protein GCM10007390_42630 [Persicitalea jodogahamensis]